ncbi:hypothetical protein SRHO_G00264920 [Serrasalmus rhombeus]
MLESYQSKRKRDLEMANIWRVENQSPARRGGVVFMDAESSSTFTVGNQLGAMVYQRVEDGWLGGSSTYDNTFKKKQ